MFQLIFFFLASFIAGIFFGLAFSEKLWKMKQALFSWLREVKMFFLPGWKDLLKADSLIQSRIMLFKMTGEQREFYNMERRNVRCLVELWDQKKVDKLLREKRKEIEEDLRNY